MSVEAQGTDDTGAARSHLQVEGIHESVGEHGTCGTGSSTTPWPDRSWLGLDSHCGLEEKRGEDGIAVVVRGPYRCIWCQWVM